MKVNVAKIDAYGLSGDGVGLIAHGKDKDGKPYNYHIHSDEMTEHQKRIHSALLTSGDCNGGIEDVEWSMGDLGKFIIKDDGDLGFSVFVKGSEKKLFHVNSKGMDMITDYLERKRK